MCHNKLLSSSYFPHHLRNTYIITQTCISSHKYVYHHTSIRSLPRVSHTVDHVLMHNTKAQVFLLQIGLLILI